MRTEPWGALALTVLEDVEKPAKETGGVATEGGGVISGGCQALETK